MATLGDLKTRIARELDRTDLSDVISSAIAQSIEHYASTRFWFNEDSQAAATTPGIEFVSIQTGGPRVEDIVNITVAGFRYALRKRSLPEIDAWLGASAGTGQPTDYCRFGDQFILYPRPNAIYTLTARGVFDVLPALVSDDISNAWTNAGADLIAARSRQTIYRDVLIDTEAETLANYAKGEAKRALIGDTVRRVATGRVRGNW